MNAAGARVGALGAARLVLLAGPTALAFFSGGYFPQAQAWAGLVAWALVLVATLAVERPLPRAHGAWIALAGLGLLAAWTLLSIEWAPIAGNAYHAGQLVVLYAGALLAATMLLRTPSAQRAVEPMLALGALVVVGYGISARLLPGLLHFQRSISAEGRLEQPLTYWNAMGELAALGFVLSVRLAGDATRSAAVRVASSAAAAPLGLGLYLSFSRGALFACAAGLVALILFAPRREQLAAAAISILAGAVASLVASPLRGVTALEDALATRERQGAITLGALVVIAIAAGVTQWILRGKLAGVVRLPRGAPAVALALICSGLALAIVLGAKERSAVPLSGGATRLATLQSDRYAYWNVALRAFAAEPLRGVGAGGWSVWWLRYRTVNDFAQDAHSLPLQTMAELGVVGLALLAAFLAGIGLAARAAYRVAVVLAAGPIAGFVTWLAHAPLDWDWQMPAVTLVAVVLAGELLAVADRLPEIAATTLRRSSTPRG